MDTNTLILSGTPSTPSTYGIDLTLNDQAGNYTSYTTGMAINGVEPGTVPDATQGQSYRQDIYGVGFQGPKMSAVIDGAVPPGLTFGGGLTGTPSQAGTFTFTVRVTGNNGQSAQRAYTLVVAPASGPNLTVFPAFLPNAVVGQTYTSKVEAAGGTPPYNFSKISGTVPPGLTLQPDGGFSGTPTTPGQYSFVAGATDAATGTGQATIGIRVIGPPPSISPSSVPDVVQDQQYSVTFTASGGTPPYVWNINNGPIGLFLSGSTGELSGRPHQLGYYLMNISVKDSTTATASNTYPIRVNSPGGGFVFQDVFGVNVGDQTLITIVTPGTHTQPQVTSGQLPPGLTITSSGDGTMLLSGTATLSGTYTFDVTTYSVDNVALVWTFTVRATGSLLHIQPFYLAPLVTGQPYQQSFTITGGTPPYSFRALDAQGGNPVLPAGLTLSPDGVLSGTPQTAGSFGFYLEVTDANGVVGGTGLELDIKDPTLTMGPAVLPDGNVGAPYQAQLTASDGMPPYHFALTHGSLPPGLQLDDSGAITGTPTQNNYYTFTVSGTDSNGLSGTLDYHIKVLASPLHIGPDTLPDAVSGQPYSVQFTASGGTPPYLFQMPSGYLSAGLAFSQQNGTLTGTPTAPGPADLSVTIQVNDATGLSSQRQFTFKLLPAQALSISPATLSQATVGKPFQLSFTVTGGTAPYTFDVFGGQLPPGFQLSPGGTLSGTPTQSGASTFGVRVTDAGGLTGNQSYVLQVADATSAAPLVILTTALVNGEKDKAYMATLQASGGKPPYQWSVTGGTLPDGLELGTDGTLSGTPTDSGNFPLTFQVTDSNGVADARNLTLRISPKDVGKSLTVNPTSLTFALATGLPRSQICVAVFTGEGTVTVSATLDSDASHWASLDTTQITTPGFFCVTADSTGLDPGSYSGILELSSTATTPSTVQIPLAMTFVLETKDLTLIPERARIVSSVDPSTSLALTNPGGADRSFSIIPPTVSWLNVSPLNGVLPGGGATAIHFEFDSSQMGAGVYDTQLTLTSGGQTIQIPVEVIQGQENGQLQITQVDVSFTGWSFGGSLSGVIGVGNTGRGPVHPTIHIDSGSQVGWLSTGGLPDELPPNSAFPLEIDVDPYRLPPGNYIGDVVISAPEAESSVGVTVRLTVLAPGDPTPPDTPLSGLFLTSENPTGMLQFSSVPDREATFQATVGGEGSGWLVLEQTQGTVPADGNLVLNVTADLDGLEAGLYGATVAVAVSNGPVRSVPVGLFIPSPAPGASAGSIKNRDSQSNRTAMAFPIGSDARARQSTIRPAAVTCDAAHPVIPFLLTPVPEFVTREGKATTVRLQAVDCAGMPAEGLTVTARLGNADFPLESEKPGIWSGAWFPANPGARTLNVIVTPDHGEPTTLTVPGTILAAATPIPSIQLVVHGATQLTDSPLAPGGWATIYGTDFATSAATATDTPFPTRWNDVEVYLGPAKLPLYFVGAGQINAVLPLDLPPNASYPLTVVRNGVSSAPVQVTVAGVSPGVFAINQRGSGQAAAVLAGTTTVANSNHPASPGEVIEIYMTGLGAVTNPPGPGEPASLTSLSPVIEPVSVTIGGVTGEVLFAGLTPGSVGLYQVNVKIPSGAPVGKRSRDSNPARRKDRARHNNRSRRHAMSKLHFIGSVGMDVRWKRVGVIRIAGMLLLMGASSVPVWAQLTSDTILPIANQGEPYDAQLTATGGTPPYAFDYDGPPPAEFVLSTTGEITGTPQIPGTVQINFQITDSSVPPLVHSVNKAILVQATTPALEITATTLPTAQQNNDYSATITVTGGKQPYHFSSSPLPSQLDLNFTTGTIAGATANAGLRLRDCRCIWANTWFIYGHASADGNLHHTFGDLDSFVADCRCPSLRRSSPSPHDHSTSFATRRRVR